MAGEPVAPLTFHCATIADAQNKALKQLGIARARLNQVSGSNNVLVAEEAVRMAIAFIECMTPMLERMEEQHARTVKVLARQLARVDAILEETPE